MSNVKFIAKGKVGEIWLYDQVGEGFFSGGMSARDFVRELQGLGKVDIVNLHINSEGGSVFDGIAIYNALKSHPARVEVDIDGLAASIASVIAMSGDVIRIAQNGWMMVHEASSMAAGTSTDLRKTADLLDQVNEVIVDTYQRRTKGKRDDIVNMMASETWLTAQDAYDKGFADNIGDEIRAAASLRHDLSQFRNAPQALTGGSMNAGHVIRSVKIAAMSNRIARL